MNENWTAIASVLLEWRDARAAFLQCAEYVAHTPEDYIPQTVCKRFADAEEKLFEVAENLRHC